ncbi:hypothetical protein [Ignavibacterium sp.]|uniref:hypothetical protein n=1 Tax=Ignavibacterium sp. TaxID=2651167 RepID=UPI0021FAEAFC|nr:hypothetical protein [Ignavibacterium sp.]BDQ01426.1 MAG: hypothetical protein KatS3mg037_0001 [Ignavibacterium sp.]
MEVKFYKLSLIIVIIFSFYNFAQDINQQKVKTDDKILVVFNNDFFNDETKSWQFASGEYQIKESFGAFIPQNKFCKQIL